MGVNRALHRSIGNAVDARGWQALLQNIINQTADDIVVTGQLIQVLKGFFIQRSEI